MSLGTVLDVAAGLRHVRLVRFVLRTAGDPAVHRDVLTGLTA